MTVRVDVSRMKGLTTKNVDKQITFGIVAALTATAKDVQASTKRQLPRWVNLTKKFIPSQVKVQPATKFNMESIVYFSNKVPLAGLMEEGGTLFPKGTTITVPTSNTGRTKRGAIQADQRPQQLLASKDTFSGRIRGKAGIWQRTEDGRVVMLYSYEPKTTYGKGQFKFLRNAERRINRTFMLRLEKSIDKALRTARR